MAYAQRIVVEIKTPDEKKLYRDFRVQCLKENTNVREAVLGLIASDINKRLEAAAARP